MFCYKLIIHNTLRKPSQLWSTVEAASSCVDAFPPVMAERCVRVEKANEAILDENLFKAASRKNNIQQELKSNCLN